MNEQPHIVIVGGGFGGLYAAKALRFAPVRVTLIDQRNFHLFQPLLYQVATGVLSPGDIASPLRGVLHAQKNISVIKAQVVDIDPVKHCVILQDGDPIEFDYLIVATGITHHYFGHDEWAALAPGLKEVEDAIEIRSRVLNAFENAEREQDWQRCVEWMTFVIVGGGPTGVELAGALGEMTHHTLKNDFSNIDPRLSQIQVLEVAERILPTYHPSSSAKATKQLEKLGVTVRTNTRVTHIVDGVVTVNASGQDEQIHARTILWAAGTRASPLGAVIAQRMNAQLDRAGRVQVERDLSLTNHPNVFVIGDLAVVRKRNGEPLPGVAPVAMQEGQYVARLIKRRLRDKTIPPFKYFDKGDLAVIGRNKAVAEFGPIRLDGIIAWFAWAGVHIFNLIEFDNKVLVLIEWAFNYFTHKRGARLITASTRTQNEKN
ncbi:MAG: NAD(P)/FAD-dependent oxidoreductase [Chloroflexi bacterium]|nr:NAD(P)/FAD-dependent oxidoreductase [Chloroflexota bacterium]